MPTLNDNLYPDIQPINIQASDIYHHLTSLQPHEAPGPDNILPTLLKIASSQIPLSLTLIFIDLMYQYIKVNYHMTGSKLMLSLYSKRAAGYSLQITNHKWSVKL